jgi:hypothetical protein
MQSVRKFSCDYMGACTASTYKQNNTCIAALPRIPPGRQVKRIITVELMRITSEGYDVIPFDLALHFV